MIANPGKFQALLANRLRKFENTYNFLTDNKQILCTSSVTLLGQQIDNKLTFDSHILTFQASGCKIKRSLSTKTLHQFFTKKAANGKLHQFQLKLLSSSISSPFCSTALNKNIESIQKRASGFFMMTLLVTTQSYFEKLISQLWTSNYCGQQQLKYSKHKTT